MLRLTLSLLASPLSRFRPSLLPQGDHRLCIKFGAYSNDDANFDRRPPSAPLREPSPLMPMNTTSIISRTIVYRSTLGARTQDDHATLFPADETPTPAEAGKYFAAASSSGCRHTKRYTTAMNKSNAGWSLIALRLNLRRGGCDTMTLTTSATYVMGRGDHAAKR